MSKNGRRNNKSKKTVMVEDLVEEHSQIVKDKTAAADDKKRIDEENLVLGQYNIKHNKDEAVNRLERVKTWSARLKEIENDDRFVNKMEGITLIMQEMVEDIEYLFENFDILNREVFYE